MVIFISGAFQLLGILVGGYFTWFRNCLMSKLDHAFSDESFLLQFSNVMLHHLPREMSDHCPLLVSDCLLENGYLPFKFLDCWLQFPNFKNIIRGFWFDGCTALPGRFGFIKKLSFVAAQLRRWNKDDFGDQEHKLQVVISQIDDLERKQEAGPLCPSDHLKLESLLRDKWTYSNRVECKWR
jgi:hypothetical protein